MKNTDIKFNREYSEEFKRKVLHVMSTEGIYPTEACRRFGITNESTVRNWIKKYNPNIIPLQRTRKPIILNDCPKEDSIENIQLKQRIKDLEKALEHSNLKAEAYSTMIDIAEKELKVSIRKKLNTKQ
jgi:transposase-like protein